MDVKVAPEDLELSCPIIMLVWETAGWPLELVSVCERASMGNACRRSPDLEVKLSWLCCSVVPSWNHLAYPENSREAILILAAVIT